VGRLLGWKMKLASASESALRELFDLLTDVQAWIKDAKRCYLWANRPFLLNYGCMISPKCSARHTPSLPDTHPGSDRFRFGSRESDFVPSFRIATPNSS